MPKNKNPQHSRQRYSASLCDFSCFNLKLFFLGFFFFIISCFSYLFKGGFCCRISPRNHCVFLFQSCPESAWQKDSKADTSHLQKRRQKWPALKPDNKQKPFCRTVRQESVTVFQHRSDFVCFSQAKHTKSRESQLISEQTVKIPLKCVHHQWLRGRTDVVGWPTSIERTRHLWDSRICTGRTPVMPLSQRHVANKHGISAIHSGPCGGTVGFVTATIGVWEECFFQLKMSGAKFSCWVLLFIQF